MTHRIFHDDAYQLSFSSPIVRKLQHEGKPAVVLERTAFYPTSGGQPHDTGSLNGVRVIDVVERGEEIVHVLEAEIPTDEVKGLVDAGRRTDHLQQHHGQHLLSEAFVRTAGAETISFHLGEETCSIELDRPYVSPEQVEAADRLANEIVMEDREVRIFLASSEEVAKLPLRKAPPFEGRLRIVQVENFDTSACCGTHPRRTGEVGPILTLGAERGKNTSRVSFVCGRRAVDWARRDAAILKAAGAKLSCGRDELPGAVQRVLDERSAAAKALQGAERQLAGYRAAELAAGAKDTPSGRVVMEVFDDRDMKYLQALGTELVARPGLIALLGATGVTSAIVLAKSKDVKADLKPAAAEAFAAIGGKGGGSPVFQQGGGPGKEVAAALRKAAEKLGIA